MKILYLSTAFTALICLSHPAYADANPECHTGPLSGFGPLSAACQQVQNSSSATFSVILDTNPPSIATIVPQADGVIMTITPQPVATPAPLLAAPSQPVQVRPLASQDPIRDAKPAPKAAPPVPDAPPAVVKAPDDFDPYRDIPYPPLSAKSIANRCGMDESQASVLAYNAEKGLYSTWDNLVLYQYYWPFGYYTEACVIMKSYFPDKFANPHN